MEPKQVLISLVVPFFNEGPHLGKVLHRLINTLEELKTPFELVCVDDGSRDDTWEVLRTAALNDPRIHALCLSRNFGKEAALAAGLERARGDAVITMDGDLQHPPELIGEMVSVWRQGETDVVEAVKANQHRQGLASRWGAFFFYKLMHQLSGIPLEGASDFKLLDRKVVDAWLQMKEGSLFFRGMSAWLGFRRVTLPFQVAERFGGSSKWALWHLVELATTGITSFSSLPLHVTTLIGFLFLLFSLILGVHTLFMKIAGYAVSGFTTVILLQLIVGSCILISLGIIGNYIARIFNEVKRRPRFLVSETIHSPNPE